MMPSDTIFTYHVRANRIRAHCRLRSYAGGQQTVVIASELPDNPGMSITNAAAELATQVCQRYGIDPECLVWVEHYGATATTSYRQDPPETYDLVTFTWTGKGFAQPRWAHSSREAVAQLISRVAELEATQPDQPLPASVG